MSIEVRDDGFDLGCVFDTEDGKQANGQLLQDRHAGA